MQPMTAVKYGGYAYMVVLVFRFMKADSQFIRYFPEGTSFSDGVFVPMHARMMNVRGPIKMMYQLVC